MRRGRTLILVALVLIALIAAAAVLLPRFLNPTQNQQNGGPSVTTTQQIPTRKVVILTQPIDRGMVLTEQMVGLIDYPEENWVDGLFFGDLGEVVQRKVRVDLEAGVILTTGMLADMDTALALTGGSDWALAMEPGYLAISIPITRLSSVSYGPQPGDHVDVIATLLLVDIDTEFQTLKPNRTGGVISPGTGVIIGSGTGDEASTSLTSAEEISRLTAQIAPGGAAGVQGRTEIDPTLGAPFYILPGEAVQRPRMVSQSILQNVTVLRVGNFPAPDEYGNYTGATPVAQTTTTEPGVQPVQTGEQTEGTTTTPQVRAPDVITLIVSPQDAITLNYLIYSGAELTLALRPAGDEDIRVTDAVTLQYLLERYNIPVPVKLPYGIEPRLDELLAPELPNDQPIVVEQR